RYFLNVSSFGLAASVIERVKTTAALKWLPVDNLGGRANFALSTLQEVIGLQTAMVKVKIDDADEKNLSTVNFCVANARYFGGGMKIAPDARLADGFLDVINIGDIRTAKIILNAYTLYRGTHIELPEVRGTRARRVAVRALDDSQKILVEIDGELPGRLPAIYQVIPAALRVRVPVGA
ncbi:MAG: hypothetical protein LC730_06910, partial [Acidobacteria bacterium]|nr:hypothetical protein [Acidobacteriota bacterium]